MSKAVLVLDEMPGVCADCPFDHDGKCYITGEDLYWNDGDNDDNSNIGNDCPLKPLPKQANHPDFCDNGRYDKGWNACLDAIEKPEPRSVAHWVKEEDCMRHWYCSECGYVTGLAGLTFKYCPECGAEMEERHYEAD